MSKIDLSGDGSAVSKSKRRVVDLEQPDMRRLYDAVSKVFAAAVNFKPAENATADAYRANFEPLYQFVGKYAHISFGQDFDPRLMSRITIEDMVIPDGELTISFKYYTSLKYTTYKVKFRAPMAPICTTWPEAVIKHGGPQVTLEKFQHV